MAVVEEGVVVEQEVEVEVEGEVVEVRWPC